jgi:hypothetical protein
MAFNDRPIVSESSERSEESVQAVKQILSQKQGFISREDLPDVGVDLQVELIENGQATNNRFVVQIKSSQTLTNVTVDEEDLISYPFLTSRLGYLCRHSPGYGLIIVYDDTSRIAYYDLIENIVGRLSSRKDPSEWHVQERVNIHIPVKNVLNRDAAKEIHAVMSTRFKNHSLLIAHRGLEYNIPIIDPRAEAAPTDFRDPHHAAKLIRDYGIFLFNNRDFAFLLELVQRLTVQEIESSVDIRFIVAIAFMESGKLIDADYHLRKLRAAASDLDEEKAALIRLYSAKADFRFGRIDAHTYLREMQSVIPDMKLAANQLSTRIRIDSLEIVLPESSPETRKRLATQLRSTIKLINETELDPHTKKILMLFAAGNLHQLAINLLATRLTQLRIMEKTFGPQPLSRRVAQAQEVMAMMEEATSLVRKVWSTLDEKEQNGRLGAHVHDRLASMFLAFAFNMLMLDAGKKDEQSSEAIYVQRYSIAIAAFNFFIGQGEYEEAYSSLTTAMEIGELYNHHFGKTIEGPPPEELRQRIDHLARETGRDPYNSMVKQYLHEALPEILKEDGFTDMTDLEITKFAETYATSIMLPEGRIQNIVSDIQAMRRFKNAIPDPDAILLQDLHHASNLTTLYANPIIHIGRCKRCGFSTKPTTNVEEVIKEYLSNHGQSCKKRNT